MNFQKTHIAFTIAVVLFFHNQANAQTDYEKRQQANKVNNEQLNNVYQNNLPNKPATSSMGTVTPAPSSPANNVYVTDHQRKMDYYNNKENERLAAWEAKESKFRVLSADVPKNEENYYRLIELAEQAGFDYYDAMRMNGRYAPKVVELPVLMSDQQEKFDKFKEMLHSAQEKRDFNGQIIALEQAINISPDLILRSSLASLYSAVRQDYEAAAIQYELIHKSPVTRRPGMDMVYEQWGIASLMTGKYERAIWCLSDLPRVYADNGGTSIFQSYAYYLDGNLSKAHTTLLNSYTNDTHSAETNLIKTYYLIKKGDNEAASVLLAKAKEKAASIQFTGDMQKDLSLLLLQYAKSKFRQSDLNMCYLLDLAADLDPNNSEIIEVRYDFNVKVKRTGFDKGMSPESLAALESGRLARDSKREADILKAKELVAANRGMLILWFGTENVPLYFLAYQIGLPTVADEIREVEEMKKLNFTTNTYLGYSFNRGYTEDQVYKEASTKLKIKPKLIRDEKYGKIYISNL